MNNKGYSGGYSNVLNAGRSGFSASGTYRAPYKLEPLVTGLIWGMAVVLSVISAIFAMRFVRVNWNADSGDMMLVLAMAVGFIIAEALIIAVCTVLVRIAGSGYRCSYISDDERFVTQEGDNSRTIYYSDVQAVYFVPRSVFGKIRGYEVTVVLNGYQERYAVISEGFISEKSTPFYIITERVEQIRRVQSHERYEQEMSKLGVSELNARNQKKSSETAANRLGQDVAMPGLNLSAMAAAVEQEKLSEDTDKIPDSYIDKDRRERSYNEVIGSGRFKVVCSLQKAVVLAVVAAAAIALSVYFTAVFYRRMTVTMLYTFGAEYAALLPGIAIAGLMAIIFMLGDECTYRANGREFVVTNKKGGETHIAYEHAQGVHYFNTLLGYKVEILTVYGVITYNCVDRRGRIYEKPEKLPFDIISKNIRR